MVLAVGKARLLAAVVLVPLYSVWSAPATVIWLWPEKPWLLLVVTVTVAVLLASPEVRVMDVTLRVGTADTDTVPPAELAGTRVVVWLVVRPVVASGE